MAQHKVSTQAPAGTYNQGGHLHIAILLISQGSHKECQGAVNQHGAPTPLATLAMWAVSLRGLDQVALSSKQFVALKHHLFAKQTSHVSNCTFVLLQEDSCALGPRWLRVNFMCAYPCVRVYIQVHILQVPFHMSYTTFVEILHVCVSHMGTRQRDHHADTKI